MPFQFHYGIHIYRTILDFRCFDVHGQQKVNVKLPVEEQENVEMG